MKNGQKSNVVTVIIQLSYTVRILICWLADLYQMILGYDKTPSLCHCRGVIAVTHHSHYTMASAHSKFDDLTVFLCAVYSI